MRHRRCNGADMPNQSALDPAGRGAERLADLFWGMTIGGTVIWLAVVLLAIYAFRAGRDPHSLAVGRRLRMVRRRIEWQVR